jgi:hypothetical protein
MEKKHTSVAKVVLTTTTRRRSDARLIRKRLSVFLKEDHNRIELDAKREMAFE